MFFCLKENPHPGGSTSAACALCEFCVFRVSLKSFHSSRFIFISHKNHKIHELVALLCSQLIIPHHSPSHLSSRIIVSRRHHRLAQRHLLSLVLTSGTLTLGLADSKGVATRLFDIRQKLHKSISTTCSYVLLSKASLHVPI